MANRARAAHVKQSKEVATRTLAHLLQLRSGLDSQDLQDRHTIGGQTESKSQAILGSYWDKMKLGNKTLHDDKLAEIAHHAVLYGDLTSDDAWQLLATEGGPRVLRSVFDLLIDAKCGLELTEPAVQAHLENWTSMRKSLRTAQSQERVALETRLDKVRDAISTLEVSLAELFAGMALVEAYEVHYPPYLCEVRAAEGNVDLEMSAQFRTMAAQWYETCVVHKAKFAHAKVEECFAGEVGDLPELAPTAVNSNEALDGVKGRLLELFEPPVDEHEAEREVFVADFTEYYEPLPTGKVVRLLWTAGSGPGPSEVAPADSSTGA
jgi:hypothetical protein